MNILYGVSLLAGFVAMLVWLAATAIAAGVEGWGSVDPERRWGGTGRSTIAGLIGFGMAGISALYTTVPDAMSLVAAVVGALTLVFAARWFAPPPAS